MAKRVTPRSEEYSLWYLDVLREAEMVDYGPVSETIINHTFVHPSTVDGLT